ncbi:LysR substrate-binding domain-containing protein [Shewanella khirikhana]|nr:LysR substrate-binding domain-containing protein [Shewanella khirikhana]
MMRWEGICEFVAVAEAHSFTTAAGRLGISTAQVSRQVRELEERLGSKLLYRTTRKVSLTEDGQLFYRHCRQVLDGLDEAERAVSSLKNEPRGLIRMTAPVTYGEQYVMPIVLEYMQQFPQVEVQCELTNQQLDLVQGGFDLAIRLGVLPDSSMMARKLAERVQYLVASPEYVSRHGAPHSLSELSRHQCLLGSLPFWRFQEEGKLRSLKVKGRLSCSSGNTLLAAALAGMGIAQLPGYYVDEAIRDGRLLVLLKPFQEPKEGIWGLYPHNRQLSPKIGHLMNMLAGKLPKA